MEIRLMSKRFLAAALLLTVSAFPAYAAKTSLVVGMPIEPPGLDPTIAAPVAIREVTLANLYEGLVRIDRNGKVQPLLAKSWEISPDGLTYTFRLQEGVKFHDGGTFDSADVKFAFDRARDPKSTKAQKQIFAPITAIETPDPSTVVIKLKETSGNFLTYLGWGDAVIVAPETAENNKANPVGTGPFKFKSWTRGDKVELVKNPDYWQKDKTKLETVTFRFISDSQAQVAAVRAGDVDAFPNLAAPELFAEFQKDSRFKAVAGNTEGETVAGLNSAKKPFDDVRVRRALMHAIDRKTLIEGAYSGFGTPIGSFFSPNNPAYVDTTNVIPYDPAKAKALLAEAGYANGLCEPLGRADGGHAGGSGRGAEDHSHRIPGQVDRGGLQEQGLRRHHRLPHGAARHRYLRSRQLLLQLQERQVQGADRRRREDHGREGALRQICGGAEDPRRRRACPLPLPAAEARRMEREAAGHVGKLADPDQRRDGSVLD
jgi:peptide/nickel transport system substrate-binding protein